MDYLILSPTQPAPANNGARIRILNVLKALAKNNTLTFVYLQQEGEDRTTDELSDSCTRILPIDHKRSKLSAAMRWAVSDRPYRHVKFYSPRLELVLEQELRTNSYDVVLCNFLDVAQHLVTIKPAFPSPLFVIEQHNEDHLWYERFLRMRSPLLKLFGKENIRRLEKAQQRWYSLFDVCFSVSHRDAEATRKYLRHSDAVHLAPNGIDIEYFRSREHGGRENIILFCGSMDTTMNQDAVRYFLHRIFPEVRRRISDARFFVVGRNPPRWLTKVGKEKNVFVSGTVDDVRPYYDKAKVVIAPFRLGGGTKLKILEAMAMKVPIVSTQVGADGIEVQDHVHLFITDLDDAFAGRVVDCLRRTDAEMIENAYGLVSSRYSWTRIAQEMEGIIERARDMRG